ncbi:hypothetical protein EV664_107101 [Stakelama pacifica]|uniref:Uncharacterized protein n=1 Tax=Stakelama pacifica TaxID=517720 RepID=A0A4R6FJP8_9SPHN|nr:hypothetical protein EV664_107101 [Stakelama pacifica]
MAHGKMRARRALDVIIGSGTLGGALFVAYSFGDWCLLLKG